MLLFFCSLVGKTVRRSGVGKEKI